MESANDSSEEGRHCHAHGNWLLVGFDMTIIASRDLTKLFSTGVTALIRTVMLKNLDAEDITCTSAKIKALSKQHRI